MEKKEEKKDKKSAAAEKGLGGGGKKHDSKKKKKTRFKHTHIEHHDDGSHTIKHMGAPGEEGKPGEEVSYARPDMEGMHAGLDENLGGQPEPGEGAGSGGAGAAMAALGGAGGPAGAPQA